MTGAARWCEPALEKAQLAVGAALAAVDAEMALQQQGQGTVSDERQLSRFRLVLFQMAESLASRRIPEKPNRPRGMGNVVVDSWPMNSQLGQLLIAAEKAYLEL